MNSPYLFIVVAASVILSSGCKRMVQIGITSRYPFPVEVYNVTDADNTPSLLGIASSKATFYATVVSVADGSIYRFKIKKAHGPLLKQIAVPSQTINDAGTLTIGP